MLPRLYWALAVPRSARRRQAVTAAGATAFDRSAWSSVAALRQSSTSPALAGQQMPSIVTARTMSSTRDDIGLSNTENCVIHWRSLFHQTRVQCRDDGGGSSIWGQPTGRSTYQDYSNSAPIRFPC